MREPFGRDLDAVLHVDTAVEDVAEVARPDAPLDGLVVGVVPLVEVDLQEDAGLPGRADHLAAALDGHVQGLLDEDVLAGPGGRESDLAVEVVGGGDADRIQRLLPEHLAIILVDRTGVPGAELRRPPRIGFGDGRRARRRRSIRAG